MLNMRAFIFIFVSIVYVQSLNYTDLELLGAECPPRDTCHGNSTTNEFTARNCECDSNCKLYNDCCIDAPQRYERLFRRIRLSTKCMDYGAEFQGVYVIDKCSRRWRGPDELRRKCEVINDVSDPLMAAPTTDTEFGITYKNRYCAECNSVAYTRLESWRIGLRCDSLDSMTRTGKISKSYAENHLIYKTTYPFRNSWGVFFWNETVSRMDFHPCRLSFVLPESISEHVRFCRKDVISTCSPEWRLHVIRQQCESYMAVVYVSNVAYKNPHCVLCNNLDLSMKSCFDGLLSRRNPGMSFTLLLDVNTRDGNRVGRIQQSQCPGGQKWDPFFQKCRALVCALPGYKMVNGKCVR